MASYTDVTEFHQKIWPDDAIERRFAQEAAEIAYEYINSTLGGVYSVPFSATYPEVIVKISDLLTRVLAERIAARPNSLTLKDLKDMAPLATSWLEDIANKKKVIPGVSVISDSSSWINTADQMHIFDIDDEIYHAPDEDRLDDLLDDRTEYP